MNIWWCRGCGLESTSSMTACPSCGSAMKQADLEWLDPHAEGEETVFELEPEPIERAAIVDALIHERIRHRWETDNDLVIADINAEAVDAILDEILGVETREDGEGYDAPPMIDVDDDGIDDEEQFPDDDGQGYRALSQLYLSVDRLQNSREDDEIMNYATATGVVLMSPPPFGVDEETWADIQSTARNTATALEEDHKAPIDADLKAFRNQLHQMV